MRRLNELDYTIVSTDRASGFIRARRKIVYTLGPDNNFDRLTVSVYPSSDGRTQLRVVSEMERDPDVFPATKDAIKARQDLLRSCGTAG